jgi:hypothetical protein
VGLVEILHVSYKGYMSTLGPTNPEPDADRKDGELQFERAEYSGGHSGPSCCTCKRPAESEYHQLNGRVFCTACRSQIEHSIEKLHKSGSLLRAGLFGLGAAVVGSLIYYAVSAATGYEFGLIAVVVGLLVGKAVRKGSGSVGGPRYQALAILLTYFSIASSYVPTITKGVYALSEKREKAEAQAFAQAPPGTPPPPQRVHMRVVPFYSLMFGLALAAPVLGGFRNIIGLVIIGFALWEAWKFNRRVQVKFTGPFAVAGAQPSPGS